MPDYDEWTNAERRAEIAFRVGMNESSSHTGLEKKTINSLLAYLTGEFACRPALIHAEHAPDKHEMMEEVAVQVEAVVDGNPMAGWFDRLDHSDADNPPWNSDELVAILDAMDERGDQRAWT